MWNNVSNITGTVNLAFLILLVICVLLLCFITFAMVYFVIKYNRKRHPVAEQKEGSVLLEIIWTAVPVVLVMLMFYFGWTGFRFIHDIPENAMEIRVTGRMWSWSFTYGSGRVSDLLIVPAGQPVKLTMESLDVTHSFYIPAFRVKQDAVPGKQTQLWFNASEPGTYDVLCAEYCGLMHAYMTSKVVVMTPEEFTLWYGHIPAADTAASTPQGSAGSTAKGSNLLHKYGCIACHSTDGSKRIGPTFKGIFGRKTVVITDGKEKEMVADEEYLRRAILDPGAEIVKGYVANMPSQSGIGSDTEITDMIAALKKL